MLRSQDYHSHISKVRREPSILTDVPQYPNAHVAFNKKVVYEEDEIEGSQHHHFLHHNNPETRERVEEVVECEQVVYEENVDVETNQYYPRRNRGGLELHKWKTFRP
ncbi:phloem specific protein [Sesbania bispinosa]|nr:phloem specific protein [Sesbania bispinosa]